MTLAETIRHITEKHLTENDGILLGQAISAVGWVNGTVPNCKNIVELPMTDVAGAGFAVGAALVGRRPIFVLRFQDFIALNGSPIFNYAAKSKELHGIPAPVFIRCIGTDFSGPVHSGIFHNIAMTYPGIRVCAPMTSGEYKNIWEVFYQNDDPMYVSEHRRAYNIDYEMCDEVSDGADIVLYGISDSRLNIINAAEMLRRDGVKVNVVHITWLKPLNIDKLLIPLKKSANAIIVDSGFEICGASRSIAYELMIKTGKKVYALALKDRTKCLCKPFQNPTPTTEQIYYLAKEIIKSKK